MPYRSVAVHRPAAITLAAGLSLIAGLALGACAGSVQGGAAQPSSTPTGGASLAPTFDPDTYRPSTIATATLLTTFRYAAAVPLHVRVTSTRQQDGLTIQSIVFAGSGDTSADIPAEIVAPSAPHGRLPGVVYAHGGQNDDPEAFLDDALTFAKHGGVALMTDFGMTMVGDPAADTRTVVRTITDDRRALDVLVARPDVDPHRLGFVGHSWGADQAAIMAGVEPRLAAVVIVSGWSRMSTDMAATAGVADVPAYLTTATILDGFRYVAIAGRRAILIQYGTQDPNIPQAQRIELTHTAVGHVTRTDYDAGHDLVNDPKAAADREAFLVAAMP